MNWVICVEKLLRAKTISFFALHRLEDLEQQVEQLTIVIHDTEFCLEQRARQIRVRTLILF